MLLAVLLDTKLASAAPVCNRSHPLVGFQGALSSREHGVGGLITIIDDCNFVAQRFTYDGKVSFSLRSKTSWHRTCFADLEGFSCATCKSSARI